MNTQEQSIQPGQPAQQNHHETPNSKGGTKMSTDKRQFEKWGRFILSQAVHTLITLGILGVLLLTGQRAGALNRLLAPTAQTESTGFTTINYQGRLADATGQPVSDTLTLQFALYDAATDGNLLWTETHPNVPVSDGLFSVRLGSQTSGGLPFDVFGGGDVWLETTVEGETLSPREKLAAVPYAMQASEAEHTVVAERAYTLSAPDGDPEDAVVVDDDGDTTTAGDVRVGLVKTDSSDAGVPGYGNFLKFSGAPHTSYPSWDSDNSDPLWLARYNVGGDLTELRMNIGDNAWSDDAFAVGFTHGGEWHEVFRVDVHGNMQATGSKSAVVETEHYGQRKLYAFEQATNRLGDEGKAALVGGVARVDLDPVFLETIEGEFLIHVTPYGPASLYVAEIGEDYFIVRAQEGNPDVSFAWQLTAFRKGYADVRLEEANGE